MPRERVNTWRARVVADITSSAFRACRQLNLALTMNPNRCPSQLGGSKGVSRALQGGLKGGLKGVPRAVLTALLTNASK
eukprot:1026105-Amphidinium_carterae.1